MIDDKLTDLLKMADQSAGSPQPVDVDLNTIRRRARQRQAVSIVAPGAIAAALVLTAAIWGLSNRAEAQKQREMAVLENRVAALAARADATLNLVRGAIERERRQRTLDALKAELAAIPDPLQELQVQTEKTAFLLVYQADHIQRELNNTDAAIRTYRQVVELFPKTQGAEMARRRLADIENRRLNKTDSKGEPQWKRRNA